MVYARVLTARVVYARVLTARVDVYGVDTARVDVYGVDTARVVTARTVYCLCCYCPYGVLPAVYCPRC